MISQLVNNDYMNYAITIKKYPKLLHKVKNLTGPYFIVIKKDELFMNGSCGFGERKNAWVMYTYNWIPLWNKGGSCYIGGEVRLLTFTHDLPLSKGDFE